jgi:hypothetical protein
MAPSLLSRPPARSPTRSAWCARIFEAAAAKRGGVVRRSVRDVEREIGREALELEVRRRGFHLIEVGGQFVIICCRDQMRVLC